MVRERVIRLVAGTLVLASLALGLWASKWWFLLTALVGLNLFQSALTGWCLMDDVLRKGFGVKSEADRVREEMASAPAPRAE
ncbi:MAG TPA: DUF2892 domain-containing protein [Sumerlaeia bacterium]|nr:DUF2892 domain-containing protein [Sumerlaeia bacterium]